jgi:hypothetical protein
LAELPTFVPTCPTIGVKSRQSNPALTDQLAIRESKQPTNPTRMTIVEHHVEKAFKEHTEKRVPLISGLYRVSSPSHAALGRRAT